MHILNQWLITTPICGETLDQKRRNFCLHLDFLPGCWMSTQPATWKWKRQLLSESRPSGLTDKVFRIFDGGILYLWYGEPTNYFCLKLGILPTIDSNLKTSHISISLQIWSERPGTRLPDDRWCWGSAGPEGPGALHCEVLHLFWGCQGVGF